MPVGQDFFEQSNAYTQVIAIRIIDMTVDVHEDPMRMVDVISALGLRHLGNAISEEFFGPLVDDVMEYQPCEDTNSRFFTRKIIVGKESTLTPMKERQANTARIV